MNEWFSVDHHHDNVVGKFTNEPGNRRRRRRRRRRREQQQQQQQTIIKMNNHNESSSRFRSVLPHEALPKNEEYGYVHIQGGFTPKLILTKKHDKDDKDDKDESKEEEEVPTIPCIETLTSIMADFFKGKLYSNDPIVKQMPHTNLLKIDIDIDGNKKTEDSAKTTCCNSTASTSFTKARLHYPSPQIARDVVSYIRSSKLTPFQIFQNHHNNINNNDASSQYAFQYSSKTMQASQVTQNELPPPNIAWPKVGPPKFRRLLPNQSNNSDEEKLAYERSQTRFLFMTNIIDEQYDESTNDDESDISIIDPPLLQDAIRNALQPYCTSKESQMYPLEIFLIPNKQASKSAYKYCHIGTRSSQDVQSLINAIQGKQIELQISMKTTNNIITIKTGKLFLDHAAITQRCEAKLRLKGTKAKGEPPRPECTSTTKSIIVPGLKVIQDFCSMEEEQSMLAVLNGPNAPWAPQQSNFSKTGSVKRRVQHYGYVFDYETADVLRDRNDGVYGGNSKACCPPMPSLPDDASSTWSNDELNVFSENCVKEGLGWDVLASIVERVRRYEFSRKQGDDETTISNDDGGETSVVEQQSNSIKFPYVNQMTVNEYKRGQGIGSHIDTKSAFSDGLISVSLGADCVMEFTEQNTGTKKLVHLPPRSLLLMSGPARYSWEHMIVSRGTDCVDGKVIPRNTRTSLTLRTAITLPDNNKSATQPLTLVESSKFPPCWGNQHEKLTEEEGITTPEMERQHVHAVYDAIAKQWHHTRGKRGVLWPGATTFLKSLPRGSVVADVGCGDGKYFPAIWNAGSYVIGTDISLPLLETSIGACVEDGEAGPEIRQVSNSSYNARPPVAVADCMNIPLRSQSCDAAICIAVMHHLSTRPRRLRCLQELARIVKKGGTVNVQAWAYEQENNSKRKFAGTDVFVPFNSQPRYLSKVAPEQVKPHHKEGEKSISTQSTSVAEMYSEAYDGAEYDDRKGLVVFQRYCHMYKEGELESLVAEIDNLEVLERGFETGNHFVIFKVI